jgi:hypothetical protein
MPYDGSGAISGPNSTFLNKYAQKKPFRAGIPEAGTWYLCRFVAMLRPEIEAALFDGWLKEVSRSESSRH